MSLHLQKWSGKLDFVHTIIPPSFLERFMMLEVPLMKTLLGHELCPKAALTPFRDKGAKTSIFNARVCTLDLNLLKYQVVEPFLDRAHGFGR